MNVRTAVIPPAAFVTALALLRLHYGAAAVALFSASLAVVWVRLRPASARLILPVLAPLGIAYAFYNLHWWMLTASGPHPDGFVGSYAAWASAGLALWGAAGLLASLVTTLAVAAARSRERS